ncbi:MAG: hypothetical protein ABH872_02915 [Candidatus Omnitrophota bacterium]
MDTLRFEGEKIFSAHGIQGTPGLYPLTDGMIFKIGSSAARLIFHKKGIRKDLKIIIARDSTFSLERIELILADAISFYGIDVALSGIIPIGGLSMLIRDKGFDLGIMISSSSLSPQDNGIRFFSDNGMRLSKEDEDWMEQLILGSLINYPRQEEIPEKGSLSRLNDSASVYIDFLAKTVSGTQLKGLKIALDCRGYEPARFASRLFEKLGIGVTVLADTKRVSGIDENARADFSVLSGLVKRDKKDAGFAFDHDGDRLTAVCENGRVLDGDDIMALFGLYLLQRGRLSKNTLVTTVASNSGLKEVIERHSGKVIYTKVGYNYVASKIYDKGLNFGGEKCGHILFTDYLPVSDGLLTAVQILAVMKETNKPLSKLTECIKKRPQVECSVAIDFKRPFSRHIKLKNAISKWANKIKSHGRLLVRYSETDKLLRIVAESDSEPLARETADSLKSIFISEFSAG